METTDLHVHVLPYDYYADQPCDMVGLARTASLIASARAEAANSLLVDNGDFLQGNPMGDCFALARDLGKGQPHPIFAAMNRLGYDAATLGNHEFNYGLDFLMAALQGAEFPVISANIALSAGASARQDRTLLPPYVLLDRTLTDGAGQARPIRIGIIGFAPPQITQWDRAHLEGRVTTRDIVETAAARVPQMREQGCDVIIALSHSGIGATEASPGMENASVPLARVPGIDAVCTGHSHLVFPSPAFAGLLDVDAARGTLAGKPAVMAGLWGSHLGVIDLLLEQDAGAWRVLDFTTEARPIWTRTSEGQVRGLVASDTNVAYSVTPHHARTLAYARRPIGQTARPLHSFFALVTPSPAVQIVADAQARRIAEVMQGTPDAGLTILSAAAPLKTGGRGGPLNFTDVPAGDMALRHAADLYVFPNSIAALKLTGAEIADWLERAVGIFRRITPGEPDQPLIDPAFPSYNFDMIHGLEFQIDLSQPARYDAQGELAHPGARRITDLRHRGAPLREDEAFVLATNSFRASGAGAFTKAPALWTGTESTREVLLRHIATTAPDRPPRPFWRFAPLPGTSVTFETAPAALAHVAEVAELGLVPLPPLTPGFARFRLPL